MARRQSSCLTSPGLDTIVWESHERLDYGLDVCFLGCLKGWFSLVCCLLKLAFFLQ